MAAVSVINVLVIATVLIVGSYFCCFGSWKKFMLFG